MKLVQPPKGISFYESFSDLIFGTLCIFVVVVFALVLKIKKAEDTLQDEVRQLVSPNRFVGGSDDSIVWCELIEKKDGLYICFVPERHVQNLNVRYPDPAITAETEQDLNEGAYLQLPLADQSQIAEGLVGLEPYTSNATRIALQEYYASNSSLLNLNFDQYIDRREAEFGVLLDRSVTTAKQSATLKFSAKAEGSTKRKLRVGEYEMSPVHFKNLVRAIKPGSGFVIEYVDWETREATGPPEWVLELLKEVGFGGRTLKVNALNELLATE